MRLQLVHVVEPIPDIPWLELDKARRNTQRHRKALAELTKLKDELAWAITECHVAAGKPANEIAKLASSTAVGLVIMTRRPGKGLFGPKQGSISYQVLTRAKTAVLALPSDKKVAAPCGFTCTENVTIRSRFYRFSNHDDIR